MTRSVWLVALGLVALLAACDRLVNLTLGNDSGAPTGDALLDAPSYSDADHGVLLDAPSYSDAHGDAAPDPPADAPGVPPPDALVVLDVAPGDR
jgi:hypothetical protein